MEEQTKIKAQICFAGNANIEKVREQLIELRDKNEFEFYCCFLPRNIVREAGFSTEVVDTLEGVLGDNLTFMLEGCKTFKEAMEILPAKREETAMLVNRMFVLDSGNAKGVREEIEMFTKCKVILMP